MMKTLKNTKILVAGAAVAASAFTAAAGCYLMLPSGYMSIDINPSIEIRTNRLDRVTSVSGVNEDGKNLLEGYRLQDRDLEDVVEDLVDRMVLQGYLNQENSANLLVTTEEGTIKPETLKQVNTQIADYLEYRSVSANVIGQSVEFDDDLIDRAKEQNISVGKLSVIDRLLANDPTLHPEELRDTSVGDLLAFAREKNISLELLEERLSDLEDRYDDTRYDEVVNLLEEQLDDADDINDDQDDGMDDLNDAQDDDMDDLNDAQDDDMDDLNDAQDDDMDDFIDDQDDDMDDLNDDQNDDMDDLNDDQNDDMDDLNDDQDDDFDDHDDDMDDLNDDQNDDSDDNDDNDDDNNDNDDSNDDDGDDD